MRCQYVALFYVIYCALMEAILKRVGFFRRMILDLRVGAITPSSQFVIRDVVALFPEKLTSVIELGPGDGVLTKVLLQHLTPGGVLTVVEVNPEFANHLRSFNDTRLTVLEGAAQDIHWNVECQASNH